MVVILIKKYGRTSFSGMGQVQNGFLYMKYKSISHKTEAGKLKSIQTISLCYSDVKSPLLVPLTFNRVYKTKHENFNFNHLLSSFLPMHKLKTIRSMQILEGKKFL